MSYSDFFRLLGRGSDAAWRRFWFQPRDPRILSLLRIIAGVTSIYFLLSFTTDLVDFFGQHGALDRASVARLVTSFGSDSSYRFSLLQLWNDTSYLYMVHVISLLIAVAMTLGIFSRLTTPLTLLIVLSYIHRAPMITGQLEPVLTMVLAYLSIAPSGRYLSFDAWLRKDKEVRPSVMANISLRLIQLHLAAIYLMTGLTMLSGDIWWIGEAMLWLSANPESRLASINGLQDMRNGIYIVNLLTHATVAFMLVYGVFAWKRLALPLLAVVSIPIWIMIAMLTGLVSYAAFMLMLNVAFWLPAQAEEAVA